MIRKLGSWLLVIPSVVVAILLVELLCRVFSLTPQNAESRLLERIFFLDGRGAIFENHDGIFTYLPHNDVRILTAFFSEHGFSVEYDYRIHSNNFGLVQDADIAQGRPSLLLLGDSFTEGLGAEPWFRRISPDIEKQGYQPINGGLRGAGFQHWLKLQQLLAASDIQLKKLAVVFISDDYQRPLSEIKSQELQCLAALADCPFGESYCFRLPPPAELAASVDKIRMARAPMVGGQSWLGAHAEKLLPASYRAYKVLKDRLRRPGSDPRLAAAEAQSRAVIAELLAKYGRDNIVFIHIPQKNETASGGPIGLGLTARRAIQEAGGKLVDGFKLCGLTPADYYRNDDHPNATGYAKIAACTGNAINDLLAGTR